MTVLNPARLLDIETGEETVAFEQAAGVPTEPRQGWPPK